MQLAPSYIASVVGILVGLQSLVGLSFNSNEWTAFVLVCVGIFTAIRQVLTGRSTLAGRRPDTFEG